MLKVGDMVTGKKVYGLRASGLTGRITKIEHPDSEGSYVMNDIITIEWSDGQVSRFYRKDLR